MDRQIVHEILSSNVECLLCACGLSFYARERIPIGTQHALDDSHPHNAFHLAATARNVYAEDQAIEGFHPSAYFTSLHPHDRSKLAECINQKNKDEADLQKYELPDTFKAE